jgi:hypothetical protein
MGSLLTRDDRWGRGIVPGAWVTSRGRHGAGQPLVIGVVIAVDGQMVTLRLASGKRAKRTISKLRTVD